MSKLRVARPYGGEKCETREASGWNAFCGGVTRRLVPRSAVSCSLRPFSGTSSSAGTAPFTAELCSIGRPAARFRLETTAASAPWSNHAGINRACMLSTLLPDASPTIGSTCGFSGTVVAAAESIVIGDRVLCGVNSTITDTDWHGVYPADRRAVGRSASVSIQDDVWIGMGAVVLKGVTIGHGSVVAAGSVVTRSLPPLVIAGGNPARVVREL